MSDTHINTYLMEVQEKEQAVTVAKGQLAAAQDALKAHPDYVAPKTVKKKSEDKSKKKQHDSKGRFVGAKQ